MSSLKASNSSTSGESSASPPPIGVAAAEEAMVAAAAVTTPGKGANSGKRTQSPTFAVGTRQLTDNMILKGIQGLKRGHFIKLCAKYLNSSPFLDRA